MSKLNKRIQSNLLQQNCFVRDVCNTEFLGEVQPSHYVTLNEVVENNGTRLEYQEVDYPITPEYVNSFVDSADYRNDVSGAISSAVSKQNLGDISGVQQVMSMNSSDQRLLYEQLKAKFSNVKQSDVKSESEVKSNE